MLKNNGSRENKKSLFGSAKFAIHKKNGAWVSSVSFGGKILVDFLNPNIAVFYRIHMVLKPYGKRFVFHSGYAAVC